MELFHSQGRTPEQSDELKMMERGSEIDKAVDLSIVAEMGSGPAEVSEGICGSKTCTSSGEQSKSKGGLNGGGEGGKSGRGSAEVLKQLEKKLQKILALS